MDDAVNLLDGLVAFFQFESDLAYQKNPPSGYLLAGVDLIGGLEKLKTQVKAGAYKSEVLFESDLAGLLGETHNGHLQFLTDGLGVFNHQRNLGALVSISSDGIELPQVYLTRDAYHLYLNGTPAQPVTAINGVDVVQWLTNYALNTTFRDQDPDTLYNVVMYEVANADSTGGYFTSPFPNFYIGAETNITYANGTTKSSMNTAQTNLDFTGVHDGKSYYNKFCNANNKQQSSGGGSKVKRDGVDAALLNRDIESRRTKQIPYPRSQYPPAVVEASDGSFAGYFLNGTGFENVAVLSILSVTEDVPLNAQKMVKEFIRLCQANGRDHLIIDQQSNGGGLIMLGYDTFKQVNPRNTTFQPKHRH